MSSTVEYIAVLPENIQTELRYLRLPHPRTGVPQLYLPFAQGLCEVVKVSGSQGRTWFIGEDKLAEGTILMHNPVDSFFLAVPIALSLIPTDDRPYQFQPLSDLLSTAASSAAFALKPAFSPNADVELYNADMAHLIENKNFRAAFRACCNKKLIGEALPSPPPEGADAEAASQNKPAAYYRPSRDAVLTVLKAKVAKMADPDNFDKFDHLIRSLGRDGLLEKGVNEKLVQAARIRASVDQIAQYLPPALTSSLLECYDTLALDGYLADRMAAARAAAAPIVQKGNKDKTAAGKRKATPNSRGVESLKKVRTDGMAKMTTFFKPKAK